jgi:hypothetical protein
MPIADVSVVPSGNMIPICGSRVSLTTKPIGVQATHSGPSRVPSVVGIREGGSPAISRASSSVSGSSAGETGTRGECACPRSISWNWPLTGWKKRSPPSSITCRSIETPSCDRDQWASTTRTKLGRPLDPVTSWKMPEPFWRRSRLVPK